MWEKAEFEIVISLIFKSHKKQVKGYVLKGKGICIHRCLTSNKLWRITHMKSGGAFAWPQFKKLSKAKKYAERIAAIEIDGKVVNWNLATTTLYRKHTKTQLKELVGLAFEYCLDHKEKENEMEKN